MTVERGSGTGGDVRRVARLRLAEHGLAGTTLRAVARDLGITAPALYRYFGSREKLVEYLRGEVSVELSEQLAMDAANLTDTLLDTLFAVCRGFRRWGLAHPHEFTLLFPSAGFGESANSVFITSLARALVACDLTGLPDELVPAALRSDIAAFRQTVLSTLARNDGEDVDAYRLPLAAGFFIMQVWVRIYGHVALEVADNFPFSQPDAFFDAMLADLAATLMPRRLRRGSLLYARTTPASTFV